MIAHPPVDIIGGDLYLHDVYLQDESGNPFDITGHTFTVKMRDKREGTVIAVAVMTAAVYGAGTSGVVRIQMSAAATSATADVADFGVYALRDDTLQTTILTVDANIEKGVAS